MVVGKTQMSMGSAEDEETPALAHSASQSHSKRPDADVGKSDDGFAGPVVAGMPWA